MLTESQLRALPKVELHRHLDGSVRPETMLAIARRHGIDLGADTVEGVRRAATVTEPRGDLAEVLAAFSTLRKILCSGEALSRIAFENVEDAFRDGVKLLELRFAPAFIAAGRPLGNDEILEGVADGVLRAARRYPVEVGLIGILPRSMPAEDNARATEDLVRFRASGHPLAERLCGFDLADGETESDPRAFVPFVDRAREAGLGITIHSGENTDAAFMRRTLELFRPRRIGHGIRARGDADLMALLRDRGIALEVCPTSNWLTRSVPSLEEHPLPDLYRAGVPLSINSDDPQLMGIDLTNEYAVCARLYGLRAEDFLAVNRAALGQSFLPADVVARVRRDYFT